MKTEEESFIPPQPEIVNEQDILEEKEIKMDPFTEAEVLNASKPTENTKLDDKPEKESSGLIKRFTTKSFFGSNNKNRQEPTIKKESKTEDKMFNKISINKKADSNNIKAEADELSLEKNISVKSNSEKNIDDDVLDIPTFLRRQSD